MLTRTDRFIVTSKAVVVAAATLVSITAPMSVAYAEPVEICFRAKPWGDVLPWPGKSGAQPNAFQTLFPNSSEVDFRLTYDTEEGLSFGAPLEYLDVTMTTVVGYFNEFTFAGPNALASISVTGEDANGLVTYTVTAQDADRVLLAVDGQLAPSPDGSLYDDFRADWYDPQGASPCPLTHLATVGFDAIYHFGGSSEPACPRSLDGSVVRPPLYPRPISLTEPPFSALPSDLGFFVGNGMVYPAPPASSENHPCAYIFMHVDGTCSGPLVYGEIVEAYECPELFVFDINPNAPVEEATNSSGAALIGYLPSLFDPSTRRLNPVAGPVEVENLGNLPSELERDSVTADGVTQLLLRVPLPATAASSNIRFEITSGSSFDHGALSEVGAPVLDSESEALLPSARRAVDVEALLDTQATRAYAFAVYTAPTEVPSGGVVSVRATTFPDGQPLADVSISVIQPPVLGVGPAGNATNYIDKILRNLTSNGFRVYRSDYSRGRPQRQLRYNPGLPYDESIPLKSISEAISFASRDLRSRGVAFTQFDVVAGSSGGLIARSFELSDAGTQYNEAGNFDRGYFNKLITVATPHLGSELADYVVAHVRDGDCAGRVLNAVFPTDAIEGYRLDARVDDGAAELLNSVSESKIPVRTIQGVASTCQKIVADRRFSDLVRQKILEEFAQGYCQTWVVVPPTSLLLPTNYLAPEAVTTIFPGFTALLADDPQHDLTVREISAIGPFPAEPTFSNHYHVRNRLLDTLCSLSGGGTGINASFSVYAKVADLLRAPISEFAALGTP